jgi:4'-phosphopantetheinyl transferase
MESLDLWRARLDSGEWPTLADLPSSERLRAAQIARPRARRRWVAARWALRSVLARYLGEQPSEVELCLGERGKPMLADPVSTLRFNLSHSGELALIAISDGREVGVDVQLIGAKPAEFYAKWARREAAAKCHGTGLWAPLPDTPIAIVDLDPGAGFAAAIAMAGDTVSPLRHFVAEPGSIAQ